jgi:hypothetical protein
MPVILREAQLDGESQLNQSRSFDRRPSLKMTALHRNAQAFLFHAVKRASH